MRELFYRNGKKILIIQKMAHIKVLPMANHSPIVGHFRQAQKLDMIHTLMGLPGITKKF